MTDSAKQYQALEIRVFSDASDDNRYPLELRVPDWRDFPLAQLTIDPDLLASLAADPAAYGQALGNMLFGETALGPVYREAVAAIQSQQKGVQIRLRIDPEPLQALHWERLYHPQQSGWSPLSLDAKMPLSRYVLTQDWERPEPIPVRPLKMLVVIASPEDLDMYGLDYIQAEEREILHQTLDGLSNVVVTYLETDTDHPPTLDEIRHALTEGYHLVYFMCHGASTRRATVLYLEDEEGGVEAVRSRRLVSTFKALEQPPHLCFFSACETAKQSKQEAFVPLGPALVEGGGVPAVVAMTDKVGLKTARHFTRQFFGQLFRHGKVDVAMSEARALVQDEWDWSVPVLFSRLPDNQLLNVGQTAPALDSSPTIQLLAPPEPEIPPPPEPPRPPPVDDFVGRETEMHECMAQLQENGLLIINGMPGVGKSSVGAMLADLWQTQQTMHMLTASGRKPWEVTLDETVAGRDRVFWQEFHQGESISVLVWQLASFLAWNNEEDLWKMLQSSHQGGRNLPNDLLFDYAFQMLKEQDYLLCLDNFHLLNNDPLLAQFNERLLEAIAARSLRAIIISGHLPEFAPTATIRTLSGLSLQDTRTLLESRDLKLTPTSIEKLHHHTDGNAQFLVMALDALSNTRRPEQMIDHLLETDDLERYLLSHVDANLSPAEQEVMRAVSVLLGYPGTREVIEAVLDSGGLRAVLRSLTDRYLLTTTFSAEGRVYNQNAMLQAFYYDQLGRRERRERHGLAADFYELEEPNVLLAALHFSRCGQPKEAARLLNDDFYSLINQGHTHTLQKLFEEFSQRQLSPEQWVQVCKNLGEVYTILGQWKEAEYSYLAALKALKALPSDDPTREDRARVCRLLAQFYESRGQYASAMGWVETGLTALGEMDSFVRAHLLVIAALIHIRRGEYQLAQSKSEASLKLAKAVQEPWGIATANAQLGRIQRLQGQPDKALRYFSQAVRYYKKINDIIDQAVVYNEQAAAELSLGRWHKAESHYRQAYNIFKRIGRRQQEIEVATNLGAILLKRGKLDEAFDFLASGMATLKNIGGSLRYQGLIELHLGLAYVEQGDLVPARQMFQQSQLSFERSEDKDVLPALYTAWARMELAGHNFDPAAYFVEQAIELAQSLNMPADEGLAQRVLAQVLLAQVQAEGTDPAQTSAWLAQAETHLMTSLKLLQAVGDSYEEARTQGVLGELHSLWGKYQTATAYFDQAMLVFELLGAMPDVERTRAPQEFARLQV